ncbi:MAG: hypothetical protein AAGA91_19750 [Pseudomonadota bacterium]
MPTLIATSVVRGSQKGESHGGVFTLDFERQNVEQHIDWNTGEIDFAGRGADRGLRGIAFDGERIYIAASDELFCYDRSFQRIGSWRCAYLKHCHEICVLDRLLFLTSTGFDSLLVFDLDQARFVRGIHMLKQTDGWIGVSYDPESESGPRPSNEHHINMVHVDSRGVFFSGLKTRALVHYAGDDRVTEFCSLPRGTHNARPFAGGVLFNDTESDCLRVVKQSGRQQVLKIRHYDPATIRFAGVDDSRVARQGFGRGLCVIDEQTLAGGSSPSTITLYDLRHGREIASVNLTMDIRNAIHGLEVWPY